jgi:hypothetical protein
MALGFFGSKAKSADSQSNSSSSNAKYPKDDKPYDPETVVPGETHLNDNGSDASLTIGKQMELEADNAIKYRTCSWQKVCFCPYCVRRLHR